MRPIFLGYEEIILGDKTRYGNHSLIYLGRGKNDTWTYGMNYSYGVAGGCYAFLYMASSLKAGRIR